MSVLESKKATFKDETGETRLGTIEVERGSRFLINGELSTRREREG